MLEDVIGYNQKVSLLLLLRHYIEYILLRTEFSLWRLRIISEQRQIHCFAFNPGICKAIKTCHCKYYEVIMFVRCLTRSIKHDESQRGSDRDTDMFENVPT